MNDPSSDLTRDAARARYGEIARTAGACSSGTGCGPSAPPLGYPADALASVPAGADLSLGCGNPGAIAALLPGDVVLDLGSGAGLDCFLAARQVGPTGQVIGVDMTPDMVGLARDNARAIDLPNVAFRLGEIEHLPVADGTIDVVISNCVINLVPDKAAVFREMFRVLKPGGRVAIADMVTTAVVPEDVRSELEGFAGCLVGASNAGALEAGLREAGFTAVRVTPRDASRELVREWMPGRRVADYVLSATIEARKP